MPQFASAVGVERAASSRSRGEDICAHDGGVQSERMGYCSARGAVLHPDCSGHPALVSRLAVSGCSCSTCSARPITRVCRAPCLLTNPQPRPAFRPAPLERTSQLTPPGPSLFTPCSLPAATAGRRRAPRTTGSSRRRPGRRRWRGRSGRCIREAGAGRGRGRRGHGRRGGRCRLSRHTAVFMTPKRSRRAAPGATSCSGSWGGAQ